MNYSNDECHPPSTRKVRSACEILSMGLIVQRNLVLLQNAELVRTGPRPKDAEIKFHAPGTVIHDSGAEICSGQLQNYTNSELVLRLREVWGQFCLFCWVFQVQPLADPAGLSVVPQGVEVPCEAHLESKYLEIHAVLWRLRFEQRKRQDEAYLRSSQFVTDGAWAATIPVRLFDKTPQECTDDELLLSACEHVGMLAAIRWILDGSLSWGAPQLMAVADSPFPTAGDSSR